MFDEHWDCWIVFFWIWIQLDVWEMCFMYVWHVNFEFRMSRTTRTKSKTPSKGLQKRKLLPQYIMVPHHTQGSKKSIVLREVLARRKIVASGPDCLRITIISVMGSSIGIHGIVLVIHQVWMCDRFYKMLLSRGKLRLKNFCDSKITEKLQGIKWILPKICHQNTNYY